MDRAGEVPEVVMEAPLRVEVGATVAIDTNDVFTNGAFAGAHVGVHFNRGFAVEARASTSMLGVVEWADAPRRTALTRQLCEQNSVCDLVKQVPVHGGEVGLTLTPLQGAAWFGRRSVPLEGYLRAGFGAAVVLDPWDGGAAAPGWRPTTDVAVGARLGATARISMNVEAHRRMYIDVVDETTLEMKKYQQVSLGVSVFLGPRPPPPP